MARYWDRLQNPEVPQSRTRSIIRPGPGKVASQWGQRPLFSEPGENQPPPDDGRMATEIQLDGVTLTDLSEGSQEAEELRKEEAGTNIVLLPFSTDNVSVPPTDAQITAALGDQAIGFVGFIIDNGGQGTVFLCIRSAQSTWWTETFTKAT